LYFDLNPLGANVEYTPHNQQNGIQWTLSQSRTRKGPTNLFEIEKVRDKEIKSAYRVHKLP